MNFWRVSFNTINKEIKMKKKIISGVLALFLCFSSFGALAYNNLIKKASFGIKSCIAGIIEAKNTKIRNVEDIVAVAEVRQGTYEQRDVYFIYYFHNGVKGKKPLIAEEDVIVGGLKADILSLGCGDMIIVDTYFGETVRSVRVIASLNNITRQAPFKEQLSPHAPVAWYHYGEKKNAKNEVYLGYISDTDYERGKVKLTMTDETGSLDNTEVFYIDESTNVTAYSAYKTDEYLRFSVSDIYSIEESCYPEIDGSVDFSHEDFSDADMKIAFIYINRSKISEIVLINYSK